MTHTPTLEIARKVVETVDAGLCSGIGDPVPGQMCVEAAVCFAFGLPHNDNPPCVGEAVREFKIRLNDSRWSSDQARAKGMRKLAVAQLGSDEIDQMAFGKLCYLRGVQTLMPIVFRKVATDLKNKEHQAKFLELAKECEAVTTFEAAEKVAKSAAAYAAYAAAAASAAAYAYAYAYAYAAAAAAAAAYAAYAYAYAAAYAYAYAREWFVKNLGDDFLISTAEMGLSALVELKSPGCKWLYLCD